MQKFWKKRKTDSNSEILARECEKGAREAGNEVVTTFDKAYNGLLGWVDCFERATLSGIVTGGGINERKEAAAHQDVMQKAYAFGRGL